MIDYPSFFVFSCVFLFFDSELILSLLLTMASINSNILITKKQIDAFSSAYDLDKYLYDKIVSHREYYGLSSNKLPKDVIPMKQFKDYCDLEQSYQRSLFMLCRDLKLLIWNKNTNEFINIFRKYQYYHNSYSLNKTISLSNYSIIKSEEIELEIEKQTKSSKKVGTKPVIPDEPICSKIYRILFTNLPPLYSYDYWLSDPKIEDFENIIILLKKRFGYSERIIKSSDHKSNCLFTIGEKY